jgi:hypothetical protein
MPKAYEEIVEFIAGGTSPDSVASFKPSDAARQRVADLIELKKTSALSDDEADELSHYLEVEHIMRLAKARARQHLP